MTSHDGYGGRWMDSEAGPVVRLYALTNGRTLAPGERASRHSRLGPEHRRTLSVCRRPMPVVDLTSDIDLPLGVVRVLLGDLTSEGLLRIISAQREPVPDESLLRMVLDGLESL